MKIEECPAPIFNLINLPKWQHNECKNGGKPTQNKTAILKSKCTRGCIATTHYIDVLMVWA